MQKQKQLYERHDGNNIKAYNCNWIRQQNNILTWVMYAATVKVERSDEWTEADQITATKNYKDH